MFNLKLNLKHLRYFWSVASLGSVTKAAETLYLTPQTISGQLRDLERQVGAKLFERDGRKLVMTETGRLVYSYADEMFRLGIELQDVLAGHTPGTALTLKVGVAMVVPKLLAYRVLEPVLHMAESVRLICHEAPLVDLLADLSVHKLDVVLADSPINPTLNIRAYNHVLGESGISFFTTPDQTETLRADFPSSLDGARMLMPSGGSTLRRDLELWFDRHDISPTIVAEFDDRALMKAFGERGTGVFTSPSAVEQDVLDKYGVGAELAKPNTKLKKNVGLRSSAPTYTRHLGVKVISARSGCLNILHSRKPGVPSSLASVCVCEVVTTLPVARWARNYVAARSWKSLRHRAP